MASVKGRGIVTDSYEPSNGVLFHSSSVIFPISAYSLQVKMLWTTVYSGLQ